VFVVSLPLSRLAVILHQKKLERRAVAELLKSFAAIRYEHSGGRLSWGPKPIGGTQTPPGPAWLRKLLGDDFFNDVVRVELSRNRDFTDADLVHLTNLARRL
jgi:hypothetical protein